MRHVTPLDAFNAAAQATGSLLDVGSEEMMKANNLDLQVDDARITTNVQNWIRDNPYVGGETEEDDGKAYNDYMARLNRFINSEYNKAKWHNHSPYFQRMLGNMNKQTLETARNHSLLEQDKWRIQREDVQHAKAYANIDNAEWDIQRTLEAKMFEFESYKSVRGLNPVEEYRERSSIFNSLFEKSLNINIGNLSVSEAMKVIENNLQSLEEVSAGYLAEGETLDSFLENKQERLSDARQAVRLAIWRRNYNQGEALDNEYRRIAADASRTENPTLIRYAQRLWREGSQLREIAMDSPEYNPDDQPRIASWFPIVGGLFDEGERRGRSSSSDILDRIKESRDYWITSGAEGRSAMEAAKASFMQEMGELARELGFENIDELEHRYSREINFLGMYEDTKNALINKNPGYAAAFESLDTFLNTWKRRTNDPRQQALREQQGRRIAEYLFDKVLDEEGVARITPDQIEQEVLRLTGLLVSDNISFLKETLDNSNRFRTGLNSDRDFGKAIYEMSQHPWARFVVDGKVFTFGDEQYQRDIEGVALDKFHTITGIPLANLSIGHSKEGQYDEAAELNIIVSGRGEENETYRFVSDARGNYHVERRNGDRWEHYAGTAREAEARGRERETDQHAEAVRQEEERTRQRNMDNIFEALRNEPDQHRRQQIISAAQAGPFTVYSNDFWKAGINPNTGAAATEIPARAWNEILQGMNQHEQEVQINKWRQMGITRGIGR